MHRLGIKGTIDILDALSGNITVKELLLNGNGFGDRCIPALINFLKNPENVLQTLGIAHNDISPQGIKALAKTLGTHQHLHELNLDGNPIRSIGVQSLLSLIWKGRMKSLSMCHCEISSCDWASSLVYMTSLESLSLSYNQIDGISLQSFCESLQRCACIRHLNLSFNYLETIHAGCIGQLMKIHKGLISINLSGNKLASEVVAAIVLGIYGNCTLRALNLAWCHLTAHHASLLCTALADNSLLDLNLDFNPIPDEMRINPRMSSVYLTRRQIVESNRHALERDGNRLDSSFLVTAILRSSTATASSSGAVAEEEEHLEFAFVDELSAEIAAELWRQERLSQIILAEQAFEDVSTLQSAGFEASSEVNDSTPVQDDELKLHIDPGGVAEKAKKHLISSQSALIDVHDGKFVLSISYGRRNEIIGSIEVSERMTYYETRGLIRPLLESYFKSSDKRYLEKAYNFKLLDGLGFVLTDEAEKVCYFIFA